MLLRCSIHPLTTETRDVLGVSESANSEMLCRWHEPRERPRRAGGVVVVSAARMRDGALAARPRRRFKQRPLALLGMVKESQLAGREQRFARLVGRALVERAAVRVL